MEMMIIENTLLWLLAPSSGHNNIFLIHAISYEGGTSDLEKKWPSNIEFRPICTEEMYMQFHMVSSFAGQMIFTPKNRVV